MCIRDSNKDYVKTCRFTQNDAFASLAGHTTQRTCRWGGANKNRRVVYELLHTGFVTENRTTAPFRTGVNGQYGQFVADRSDHGSDRFNKGRFAGAWNTGDTDAVSYTHLDVYKRQQLSGSTY